MLLLAHLDRQPIPASLAADYRFVVAKCAMLLEEMVKIANLPRLPGQTCGWLAPTLGSLEMLQCLTQGVSQASRKNLGSAGKVPPLPGLTHLHGIPSFKCLLCLLVPACIASRRMVPLADGWRPQSSALSWGSLG